MHNLAKQVNALEDELEEAKQQQQHGGTNGEVTMGQRSTGSGAAAADERTALAEENTALQRRVAGLQAQASRISIQRVSI